MDSNTQKRNVDVLRHSNRLLSVAVIVLSVALIVAVVGVLRTSGNEKVVVIPATLERPVSVEGDKPSASYLEQWGLWVAHLMLDVSQSSIDITKDSLLKYTLPSSHGALENKLEFEATRLRRDAASSQFFPTQIVASPASHAVALIGQLDVYINERRTSSTTRAYAIEFQFSSGRMFLKDFYETELDHVFKRKANPGDNVTVSVSR